MIDGMIAVLGREQQDDDHKKEYCGKQFDFADDKKKGLEHDISDLKRALAQEEDGVAVLTDEIGSLRDCIEFRSQGGARLREEPPQQILQPQPLPCPTQARGLGGAENHSQSRWYLGTYQRARRYSWYWYYRPCTGQCAHASQGCATAAA